MNDRAERRAEPPKAKVYYGVNKYYKRRMWREIQAAAQDIVDKGGGDIRFKPYKDE